MPADPIILFRNPITGGKTPKWTFLPSCKAHCASILPNSAAKDPAHAVTTAGLNPGIISADLEGCHGNRPGFSPGAFGII
jgi:hypothetical protein